MATAVPVSDPEGSAAIRVGLDVEQLLRPVQGCVQVRRFGEATAGIAGERGGGHSSASPPSFGTT